MIQDFLDTNLTNTSSHTDTRRSSLETSRWRTAKSSSDNNGSSSLDVRLELTTVSRAEMDGAAALKDAEGGLDLSLIHI